MDIKYTEKIFKALANRRRLTIVQYLKKHEESHVVAIAEAIELSFKATSKHLGVLSAVDIVEKEQRNVRVYYKLSSQMGSVTCKIISLL